MKTKKIWGLLLLIIAIVFGLNIPVPYYMERPGSAIPLAPMVDIEGGYHQERGSLSLTTVRMGPTNVYGYLYASFDPDAELVESVFIHSPHETNEQFNKRQLEVMKASQDTAEIVAFQKAGYSVQIKNRGAIVMQILPGYPAEQVLQIGDVIINVNQAKVDTAKQLIDALAGKKAGDKVTITYLRDGKQQTADIILKDLPVETKEGTKKAGIGIASPITNRQFQLPKKVTIKSEDIGGPSAGLMFTLEMINQLTPEDLTKGYTIAGTGTINEDGTVGPIGGIQHKIVAANDAGAEIFFAPAVAINGEKSNYEEAVEKAKAAGIKTRIVPVETVDDALQFLKKLPEKKS